jgi:hypothetical protein
MVQIHQLDDDSLLLILEADPGVESEGSTKTITKTITDLITTTASPPRCFPKEIFMISTDSAARNGETDSQRVAREGRNVDRARHRREADAVVAVANANAGKTINGGAANQQGGHRVVRNPNEEFVQVDGHEVLPTLSANLAVAMNKLGRLPPSPELTKATAMLKAAVVQVPNILESKVIATFIQGLYHHDELRIKFNRKPPTSIDEMFTTANQYVDAEEADLRHRKDTTRVP